MLESATFRLTKILLVATVLASGAVAAMAQVASSFTSPAYLGPQRHQTVGIKYVGHVMSGLTDVVSAENVQEVVGHTNVVGLTHSAANPGKNMAAMRAISGGDVTALLVIDELFQAADGTPLRSGSVDVNFVKLKAVLGKQASKISYFAFDETMWRRQVGYCAGDVACRDNGPVAAVVDEMLPKIEAWAQRLRTEFPGTGVVYIYAGPMVRPTLRAIPANIDIVGFDCYQEPSACASDAATGATYSIQTLFQILKTRVTGLNNDYGGFRRMVLIPPAFMAFDRTVTHPLGNGWAGNAQLMVDRTLLPATATPDSAALALLQSNLSLASDPMVIMVGTFLWSSLSEGNAFFYGARGLPQVRAYLEYWGRALLNKPDVPSTLPPVIDIKASGGVPSNTTGSIFAWATTNATACRSVTDEAIGQHQNLPPNGVGYLPPIAAAVYDYVIECTGPYGTTRKTLTFISESQPAIHSSLCTRTPMLCQ